MQLNKRQRNEIFEAILRGGLSPESFELRDEKQWAVVAHRSTESFLSVRRQTPFRQALSLCGAVLSMERRRPTALRMAWMTTDEPWRGESASWANLIKGVEEWVARIKQEIDTPDLWKALEEGAYAAGGDSDDNSPFTEDEQDEIVQNLDGLKRQYEADESLDEEQIRQLVARLDYLAAAASRVGRLDWRNLVAGTMLGVLSEAVLPAETTRHIFSTLLHSVAHLLGHPVPLLPGS